jgi:hypothetical protein
MDGAQSQNDGQISSPVICSKNALVAFVRVQCSLRDRDEKHCDGFIRQKEIGEL